jgi:hypothetical protein
MRILKVYEYIKENFGLLEHDGILLIVDVQKEFEEFIPNNMVDELFEYCKEFKTVYQIWDSNKAKKPTYIFPNQKESIIKKYGQSFLPADIKLKLKKELIKPEGTIITIDGYDSHFVRVDNNHKWFSVTSDLLDLFNILKGNKIILCGGADQECLKDIIISAKSFGVEIVPNHKFIYSAEDKKTSN